MRHMSANRQWKVVDERYSGNVFTDAHWYSTHIPRIVRVRTTQTTQKIRKTAQYCANFYAKPSFELLKTWNRIKHRYGEHRRTTAEVPRQKNWWNAQIADVSRKTRNLCVIHAFTRILGSVTGPLEMQMFPDDLPLANIDADGYCCHFMHSSVRPTIHGLGFVYCIQSAWKKWPTIWHADVSRWLTLSIHGCLWILLLVCLSVHLSVCSFTAFSGGCAFADKSLGTNGIKFDMLMYLLV